jgi:hypothetical protein
MRTLMMRKLVMYAVGSSSFGGATMAQGGSAGAAKSVVLLHGARLQPTRAGRRSFHC